MRRSLHRVTVTRLDGPDGEPIFSVSGFTEADAARLASLQDPEELARTLDPLAVDSRSAALGKFSPRRRD